MFYLKVKVNHFRIIIWNIYLVLNVRFVRSFFAEVSPTEITVAYV